MQNSEPIRLSTAKVKLLGPENIRMKDILKWKNAKSVMKSLGNESIFYESCPMPDELCNLNGYNIMMESHTTKIHLWVIGLESIWPSLKMKVRTIRQW